MATDLIEGIDVSMVGQGSSVNWAALAAAGIKWAAVKASEGSSYSDPNYRRNLGGARTAGVLVMPYHFLSHDIPAKDQADHFLQVIDRQNNTDLLLPAVDVEPDPASSHALKNKHGGAYGTGYTPAYMVKLLDDFLTYVRAGLGKNLTIYSYPDWWMHYMGNTKNYRLACPLWVAAYPVVQMPLFGGWPYWTFHQDSDNANIAGLHVDHDVFKGSLDDLKKFADF